MSVLERLRRTTKDEISTAARDPDRLDRIRRLLDQEIARAGVAWSNEEVGGFVPLLGARLEPPAESYRSQIAAVVAERNAQRGAGDVAEAASQDFDSARTLLRIALVPRAFVPPTDASIPSPIEGFVEAVVLDAGTSMRYVSLALADRWGRSIDDLVAAGDEQVLRLELGRGDLGAQGSAAVRVLNVEAHGPYIGTVLRHLPSLQPDAVGLFGTLVGLPAGEGLAVRALNPGIGLAADLATLGKFTAFMAQRTDHPISPVPLWRQADGSLRRVAIEFSAQARSAVAPKDPEFDSVLRALSAPDPTSLPQWAERLGHVRYARFARVLAAAAGLEVDGVSTAYGLDASALLERCIGLPESAWYRAAREHMSQEVGRPVEGPRHPASSEFEQEPASTSGAGQTLDLRSAVDPAREVLRAEIGGVPVFHLAATGPARVALMFRVGVADEIASTHGVTHLVEHLALSQVGRQPYQLNGSVDATKTMFVARGEPDEIVHFVTAVCTALGNLPLDRVELESRILATEASGRPLASSPAAFNAWLREGARGLGMLGVREYFLQAPRRETVADWSKTRFTAGNAVLLMAGAIPPDLKIPLPLGPRCSPPGLRPIDGLTLPSVSLGPPGGVSISFVVERSARTAMALRIAALRLQKTLRHERGLSYDVRPDYEVVSADTAHATLWATCLAENAAEVGQLLLEVLTDLAGRGPTPAELEFDIEQMLRSTNDDMVVAGILGRSGYDELIGAPHQSLAALEAEMRAVTPAASGEAMAAAMSTALLAVPPGGSRPPGFHPYPGPRTRVSSGQRFDPVSRKFPWTQKTPYLMIGERGLALYDPLDHVLSSVAWDRCVAVVAGDAGARLIEGEDGFHITLLPHEWRNGARATQLVDQYAPASVVIPWNR